MSSPTLSLWQSATGKMDQDEINFLTFDQADIQESNCPKALDIIESYMSTTREAYKTCVRKRWQIKIPGKQEKIIVRDLLGKITHWIEVFKNVGDQAVSFDPGHAALPWAGARFLLQIATNDFKQFDFVVEGAAKITQITTRYGLVECLYLHRSSAATSLLRQAIIRLYATILRYISQARCYFQQRTGIRILKSGLLARDDFQDLLQRMDTDEREADHCADLVRTEMVNETADQFAGFSLDMSNMSLMRDALDKIEQPIRQTAHGLEKIEDSLADVKRREILDWISSQPYYDHHTSIQSKVLDGTCQWIVQIPEFSNWQNDSNNSLLWLHGTQGSGKSCITSSVIEKTMEVFEGNEMHALAYFYCMRDSAEPQRAMPQQILACIARQLSRRSPIDSIAPPTLKLYEELHLQDGSNRAPNIEELSALIRDLTHLYDRTMIVIDALDECDSDTRWELVEALESLTESASLVKVFISSREEGDLRLSLNSHGQLGITSLENQDDIRKFVELETDRLIAKRQLLAYVRKKDAKEELTKLIKAEVTSKANGMFRWAEMQLQSLRGIRAEKDIRSELSRIPRDLTALYQDLYERALKSTHATDRIIFQQTLKWLCCAQRVCTHWETFIAITAFTDLRADEVDEDFILDLLNNFVVSSTTEEGGNYFRFAHLSVLEFLETMPEYSAESTNKFAAEMTLLNLICASSSPNSKDFIQKLGVTPLDIRSFVGTRNLSGIDSYSVKFWFLHCVLSGERNRSAEGSNLRSLLHFFLLDDYGHCTPIVQAMLLAIIGEMPPWRLDGLYVFGRQHKSPRDRGFLLACRSGFDEVARLAFRPSLDSDAKRMEFLLGQEWGPEMRQYILSDAHKQIPRNGHLQFLPLLLRFTMPREITETVIIDARFHNTEIIGMLLDHNRDLYITEETFRNCVHNYGAIKAFEPRQSAMRIFPETIITVLKHQPLDAELAMKLIDKADLATLTPEVIVEAAWSACDHKFRKEAIPVLLHVIRRVEYKNFTELTVLKRACLGDSTGNAVRFFLTHGWPITPAFLPVAARQGTTETFCVIFNAVVESNQITPELLGAAAANREADGEMILRFLISRSSQPLNDDQWISAISCTRHRNTMQFLLSLRPDVPILESTLLCVVNSDDRENIFPVLLDDGRELEITDAVVGTVLAKKFYGDYIPQLLSRFSTDCVTERVLIGAVSNKSYGDWITQTLLDQEAPLEVPSPRVITAAIKNYWHGLKILLMLDKHFGCLRFTDENVVAAAAGSPDVMELVFQRLSIKRVTPSMLLTAASQGSTAGMEIILQLDGAAVTREVMIAAVRNERCGRYMLKLLWDHSPGIALSVEMFVVAAGKTVDFVGVDRIIKNSVISETIDLLVERIDDTEFAQKVLEAVTSSIMPLPRGAEVVKRLLECNPSIRVTSGMAATAQESGNISLSKLLEIHCQCDGHSDT